MIDDKTGNISESEARFCSTCGEKIPEGSDKCPNCQGKSESKITPKGLLIILLGVVVIGVVIFIAGPYFLGGNSGGTDISATAGDKTYQEAGITFTVKDYLEMQDLSGDSVQETYFATEGQYEETTLIRLVWSGNSPNYGKYSTSTGKLREGMVELMFFKLTGPSSLTELTKWFKNEGYNDMLRFTGENFKVENERSLTVNGFPATEITYQFTDGDTSEYGIILFIEKKAGSEYYIVKYDAEHASDFELDKVNYDMVLETLKFL